MGFKQSWLSISFAVSVCGTSEVARAEAPRAEHHTATEEPSCGERLPFWARIGRGDSAAYCRLVGRARARLQADPEAAGDLARQAIAVRSEPALHAHLISAEANLLLGRFKRAHDEFTAAVADTSDPELAPLLHPRSVAAGARAALGSGHYAQALARYRWVLLRLGDLHDPREEARVLIEAATAATYAAPNRGREARAYLASALAKNAPLLRPIAEAAWALSLFRDGQSERAARRVSQFESSWSFVWLFENFEPSVGRRGEILPVLPPGEQWAWAAVVAEGVEPPAAQLHWEKFVELVDGRLPSHLTPEWGE